MVVNRVTHSPEVEHVEQDWDFHQVEPSADVVVPEHQQTLAQLQRRPFEQVGLPVAPEDLPQRGGVDLQGVLVDQLAQQDAVLRLDEKIISFNVRHAQFFHAS